MTNYLQKSLLFAIVLGVFSLLLMPLIVGDGTLFPDTFYPFIVPKALYARTIIELVFALWVVLALWSPAYRPPKSWVLVIFGLYVAAGLVSTVFSVSPQRSMWSTYERMQGMVDLAHWFAFTVVVTSVFRSMSNWRSLLNVNLAVSLAMSLMGLVQHYQIHALAPRYLKETSRLDVTLGNPTFVGAFMMVNAAIAAGFLAQSLASNRQAASRPELAVRGRRPRRATRRPARGEAYPADLGLWMWRLFWATTLVLDIWIMSLSGTRGAAVGLFAALGALGLGYALWGRLRAARLASVGLVVLLAVGVLAFVVARETSAFRTLADKNVTLSRLSLVGTERDDGSLGLRWESVKAGLRGFLARPILGWGPDNYTVAYDRYIPAESFANSTESFDQAHNKLVEELTTKGLVGFVTYISLWALMMITVARKVRAGGPAEQLFILLIGAALAGYFVQNLFLFDTPATILQFVLLLGFTVNLGSTFEEEDRPALSGRLVPAGDQTRDRARAGRAAGLQGWTTRLARSGLMRSPASPWAAFAVALAVIGVVVYYQDYRIYNGATSILNTVNPCITWARRLDYFDESIGSFSQLGNYPRLIMITQVTNDWRLLSPDPGRAGLRQGCPRPSESEIRQPSGVSEVQLALEVVEREGEKVLGTEPRDWRGYVSLATFYGVASAADRTYLARARPYLERALELAPERLEVHQSLVAQEVAEGDYAGASETIARYLELSPDSRRHFSAMQKAIDEAVARPKE